MVVYRDELHHPVTSSLVYSIHAQPNLWL